MTAKSEMSIPVPRAAGPPRDEPFDDGVTIAGSLLDPEQFADVFRRHAAQINRSSCSMTHSRQKNRPHSGQRAAASRVA